MADLGAIGTSARTGISSRDQGPRWALRGLVISDRMWAIGAKDTSDGNPAQPSLRIDARGKFRFRWVVVSGTRTITVDVKQAVNVSPRPTLVVLANSDIGVSETSGTAGSSTGWVTIGPVSITPSGNGAVWVELRANYDGQCLAAPTLWDNIVVT